MPLGAGVNRDDPRHAKRLAEFEKAGKIVRGWMEQLDRARETGADVNIDINALLAAIEVLEEDVKDFYWQSSSAECPEDY